MRGPIYKMPPSKPLLKVEDLDKKVEDIIDLKLKDIFSRLDKIEKKVNFDENPITDYTLNDLIKRGEEQDKEN